MIEPPRQFFRRRVFEVDNGVLVRVKHREVKQVARPVQQARVFDLRFGMDAFFVEACEGSRLSYTVEAVPVIKKTKVHEIVLGTLSLVLCASISRTKYKALSSNINMINFYRARLLSQSPIPPLTR